MPSALAAKLQEWSSGYAIDDAWTGGSNALEQEIIDLAASIPPADLDCMLYRGTGVDDGIAARLASGEASALPASKRLVQSWTKDVSVARSFLENAVENNHSALLIQMHASRLSILADLTVAIDPLHDESEVLALSGPIDLHPEDVIEAWEYDPILETSILIKATNAQGPTP